MAEKTIKLNLEVDSKTGRASIKKTTTSIKKLGGSGAKAANKMTVSWKKATVAVTAFSAAIVASTKGFISAYAKQEQAEKRLAAVIKATGGAAGFTAKELYKMAAEMQKITTFGDEVTISAMAMLATFKNISGDAFPRAIMAAMDLSTVLEQDLKSSVIMIAKALNDPIANLGALGRAGVQFTKSQKELIKSLTESGKQAEAMNIILGELESQQGGAAKAARDGTGIWTVLGNAIGDVSEKLGKHLHEALEPYVEKALEWIEANEVLIGQKVEKWVTDVKEAVKLLTENVDLLIIALKILGALFVVTLGASVVTAIRSIGTAFLWVGGGIGAATTGLIGYFKYYKKIKSVSAPLNLKGWEKLRVSTNLLSKASSGLSKIIFKTVSLLATKLSALSVLATTTGIAMAAAGGYWLGTWLNSFDSIKRAAEHTWNGIFFAAKYSVLKIQLSFLQSMEKIKIGWKDLKKWFIDTFPKMAQYMDMEMPIIKDTPKIIALKNEIIALKEEYKLLGAAINKAYAEVPTLPTVTVTAERITDKDTKPKPLSYNEKWGLPDDFLDYDAEFKIFEQQLVAMSKGVEKFDADKAVRAREAAAKRAADHEKVLQYISTEEENALRAIENQRTAMLLLATTEAERREINATADREANKAKMSDLQEWAASSMDAAEQMEKAAIQASEAFASGFTDAFFEFAEGTKSAEDAFRDFATSFLKQMAKMIIEQMMLNAIKKLMETTSETASAKAVAGNTAEAVSVAVLTKAYLALATAKAIAGASSGGGGGGGTTAAAKGMVVSNGQKMMEYAKGAAFNNGMKMHAFATGGVVNSPTIFPMANGMGLMGEAGPEAIMPLKRGKDGKLGVETSGRPETPDRDFSNEINLSVTNLVDPAMIGQYLASRAGKDAIINIISNNRQTVKRSLL